MTLPANTSQSLVQPTPWRMLFVAAMLILFYHFPQASGNDYLLLLFPLAAWWGSHLLGFRGMRAWYLEGRPGWLRLLALGLLLAIAAKFAAFAIGTQRGVYALDWPDAGAASALGETLAWLLFSTFIASTAEDILTRGLVLRAFPRLGLHWGLVLLSSGLYVLNHVHRLHKGPGEWLMLFCFGLAYAAALYRSRSLWAAVGLHWGWNLANGLLDTFARADVVQPAQAPLYSGAAHLVLLVCALVLMRFKPRYRTCAWPAGIPRTMQSGADDSGPSPAVARSARPPLR